MKVKTKQLKLTKQQRFEWMLSIIKRMERNIWLTSLSMIYLSLIRIVYDLNIALIVMLILCVGFIGIFSLIRNLTEFEVMSGKYQKII